jgi:hypothetical protein
VANEAVAIRIISLPGAGRARPAGPRAS